MDNPTLRQQLRDSPITPFVVGVPHIYPEIYAFHPSESEIAARYFTSDYERFKRKVIVTLGPLHRGTV